MAKKNPEVRLLMKILAVIGFIVLLLLLGGYIFIRVRAPHFLDLVKGVEEVRIVIELDSLKGARFVQGMNGCENLYLVPSGNGVYISTLDGYIHYLDGPATDSLSLVSSYRAGTTVTGITGLSDSLLAAVINRNTPEEWIHIGAAVTLVPVSMDGSQRVTGDYTAANGICRDSNGNLYFASCNFDFLDPEGNIYLMERGPDGTFGAPEPLFTNVGLANGLYYDKSQDRIYFSNTIDGVYSFVPGEREYRPEYRKMRFMEACDDLTTDISGNIWMTDPGYSTIKLFNPGTNRLVRFVIKGIGQTSSCRIRHEKGEEVLYITELKKEQKPFNQDFDGRGLLRIRANDLLGRIKPPVQASE